MPNLNLRIAIPWAVTAVFPIYFILTWIHIDNIRKHGLEEKAEVISSRLITKSTEYRIRTSSGIRFFVSKKDFNLGDSVSIIVLKDDLLVGDKSKSTFGHVSESLGQGHSYPFYLAMIAFFVCLADRLAALKPKKK